MLELAILGFLTEGPLHGYELKKRLGESLGSLWGVSFGSLYPALRRLERSGAIEGVDPAEATDVTGAVQPLPSTGSLDGDLATARLRRAPRPGRRPRKAYRITASGREQFAALLLDGSGADDERAFALKLSFARHLDPYSRLELLERRRAHLLERVARSRRARGSGLDRYARSLAEHRHQSTERDLAWVEELIAAEREPAADQPEGATA